MKGMEEDIHWAARAIATEWPGVIEQEDIQQDMWIRLCEASDGYIKRLRESDTGKRRALLKKMARQIASRERESLNYFTGNVLYSTHQVRKVLTTHSMALEDNPNPGSEVNAVMFDIREAMVDISENYRNTLYAAYVSGEYDHQGPDKGMKLTRAVDALTHRMNRKRASQNSDWHEGPGARTAISNSEAQAVVNKDCTGRTDGDAI